MTAAGDTFDDGAAYELFMGRWSRAVGAVFLDWLGVQPGAHWLDVGCGTGVLTELIVDTTTPASVFAVDPALSQIEYARRRLTKAPRVQFHSADAQALPFATGAIDVVASALVINFVPDRPGAVAEMRRVVRPGGLVAGYVWDFAADRSPSWPMRLALRAIGADDPPVPGTADSTLDMLRALFEAAGFERTAVRAIEVAQAFPDFNAFWRAQTPGYSRIGKTVAGLSDADLARMRDVARAALTAMGDGSIAYSARAHAVRGYAPA